MRTNFFFIVLFCLFLSSCSNEDAVPVTLNNEDCIKNWGLCSIFNGQNYDIKQYETPIKIAILDSGINESHEALQGQITKKYNAIDKSSITNDNLGHGTQIASIIAAKQNNVNGQGVNPYVEIYDVKVFDNAGGGQIEHVVDGFEWSIENKVDIINLSFGFKHDLPELKEIVDKAIENNIIIVASAGNNSGLGADYPAYYENVISVGSINNKFEISDFNSYGKIDIYAPGENIIVIGNDGESSIDNGASFATAYVTGVISTNKLLNDKNSIYEDSGINLLKLEGNEKWIQNFINVSHFF